MLEKVADALIKGDPEIDIESFGMFLSDLSRVYVTAKGIVHLIEEIEVVYNPDGTEHSLAMHKAILDAIVDRNGTEARVAMRKLIDYSKGTVARVSEAKGSEARRQSKR